VDEQQDANTRMIAALDQDLGRRVRLELEQKLLIEHLTTENQKIREIAERLMEQHAPGLCQPATPESVEAEAVFVDEPTPLRATLPHPDCPACAAEAGG